MKKLIQFIAVLILCLLTPYTSFTQTLSDSCVTEIPCEDLRLLLKTGSDALHQDSIIINLKDQLELTDKIIWEKDNQIQKRNIIIKKQRGQQIFFGFLGAMLGFISFQILN